MRLTPCVPLFVSLFCIITVNHGNSITFFMRPYAFPENKNPSELLKSITKPGKMVRKVLKNNFFTLTPYQGTFATYWGYLTFSDLNGQITFPRKQKSSKLNLLITQAIEPVFMIGNTIHHWQMNPLQDFSFYSLEQIKDPAKKQLLWKVTSATPPAHKRINTDTIVIFANPHNIFVPEGTFETYSTANLILPDIYVRKNLNVIYPSLRIITIRQFFDPVEKELKKELDTYYSEQLSS